MARTLQSDLVLTDQCDIGTRNSISTLHRTGALVRLHQGAYFSADAWTELDDIDRHRVRVQAIGRRLGDEQVFSHLTAAALWRLPIIGATPHLPQIVGAHAAGGRSTRSFVRRETVLPLDSVEIDGVRVTSLATTVMDVARTCDFGQAVAIVDAALHRTGHPIAGVPRTHVTQSDLLHLHALAAPYYGSVKAGRVLEFADALSDSPGESLSRVGIHLSRLSAPQLQVPLSGASGKRYVVDFWWPEFRVIGEFDGKSKYTDPALLSGRSPSEILYAEKLREDDLRAVGCTVARWPWATAMAPSVLRQQLRRAGVR
jgi:hypothetical protein